MAVKIAKHYKLTVPDGGWGYVVVVAVSIITTVTFVPMAGFGIIFDDFLSESGDATSGITLMTSTYNTVSFFTGLIANILLKRYSYRKVCLLGSLINFFGALASLLPTSVEGLILTYGVLQGLGFGLLLPASFSAFNAYFLKRMALMMSINQTVLVMSYMVVPYLSTWSMSTYGYSGTLLLIAGLNAFCFPSSLALQPVEWHLKRELVEEEEKEEAAQVFLQVTSREEGEDKRRKSSVLLGERVASVISIRHNQENSFWQSLAHSLDLHFFTDLKYVNIALGLSLSFTADVAFFPIIPSIMSNQPFTISEMALLVSVFFSADLVARIMLSIAAAFVSIDSRLIVLTASGISAALRIAMQFRDSYNYKLAILAAMGYTRCFVQTPQALVISDHYPDHFDAAYSIYMVINGVVTLAIGALMSYTKYATNSDEWACHILTGAFLLVVVSWGAEMLIGCRNRRSREENRVKGEAGPRDETMLRPS